MTGLANLGRLAPEITFSAAMASLGTSSTVNALLNLTRGADNPQLLDLVAKTYF